MFQGEKVGVVLSGGGLRGIAHLGLLKALEEFNIQPAIISGTSIGALVGALYASGNSPERIIQEFKTISLFSIRNYAIRQPALINTKVFQLKLRKLLQPTFEDLRIPLVVNTTDLLQGKHKIFRSGELVQPIMGSFAFPGVFPPVLIENNLYVDGGVTNNFPIEPIQWQCDFVIGSYVNPLKTIEKREIKNSFSVLERVMQISMHNTELSSFHNADIFVMADELSHFQLFSFKHIDTIYKIGYNKAIEEIIKYKERK